MNYWGIGGCGAFASKTYVKRGDIRYPAKQIGFSDSADQDTIGTYFYHPAYNNDTDPTPSVRFPHLDTTNAVYCDGHIVAAPRTIIMSPYIE